MCCCDSAKYGGGLSSFSPRRDYTFIPRVENAHCFHFKRNLCGVRGERATYDVIRQKVQERDSLLDLRRRTPV